MSHTPWKAIVAACVLFLPAAPCFGQLQMQRAGAFLRGQGTVLETLQLGGDVPLGVLQGLAAPVVVWNLVGLAVRDLDVEAVHAVVLDPQPHAGEYGRVLRQGRQIFVVNDRRRHVPGRVDSDVFHLGTEHRRLHARLADDDAGRRRSRG